MLAEPSALSSVDAAAASLEDVHLQNAGLVGDGFGDGPSPRGDANGDVFELRGEACGWHSGRLRRAQFVFGFTPLSAVICASVCWIKIHDRSQPFASGVCVLHKALVSAEERVSIVGQLKLHAHRLCLYTSDIAVVTQHAMLRAKPPALLAQTLIRGLL